MNILFIGDVVGRPGRRAVEKLLPDLVDRLEIELVVANVENAAGGAGMSREIHDQFAGLGVDVLTTGNHVWDRREFVEEIVHCDRVLRPANYPAEAPGRGYIILDTNHGPAAVINLAGRVYMPPVDCPFHTADRVLAELDPDIRIIMVDFHAEATAEKQAMAYYLDGRVSAVIGTHTHVPTADAKILPQGTAFISDVGMTGPSHSVIGVKIEPVLQRFTTGMPHRYEPASGAVELNAVQLVVNPVSGKTEALRPIRCELDGE